MIVITKGDVTEPLGDGIKIIPHCCNSVGVMGAGIAGHIAQKWPHVKDKYVEWFRGDLGEPFELGEIQIVKAVDNIYVCNIIGQKSCGDMQFCGVKLPPVRYQSMEEGLWRLRERVVKRNIKYVDKPEEICSIHAPLYCTALAGGSLEKIYDMTDRIFGKAIQGHDIDFTFYAFSDKDFDDLEAIHNTYRELV